MSKQRRQFLIKEIISRSVIAHQEDLLSELSKSGEEVNQATLSRDFRDLGVSRIHTADGPRYTLSAEVQSSPLRAMISYEIISIVSNESTVIVKTLAGRAQGVAEQIDQLKLPTVLATLAGDNTIFIAPVSMSETDVLVTQLKELITERIE